MNVKKGIIMLLMLILTLALVTACTSNEETSTNTDDKATDENSNNTNDSDDTTKKDGPVLEEPTTLTMFLESHGNWPYSEEQKIWNWIEEETNVTIDPTISEGNYADSLNLSIASGDMQDIYWVIGFDRINNLGDQGAFVNLLDHKDKLPNMMRVLKENPERKNAALTADGKMYSAPSFGTFAGGQRVWLYRQDFFEEHNLQPPTSWEELYKVSKKIQEIKPGSFPFVFRSNIGRFPSMTPQFGIGEQYYNDENGEFHFGPVTDEYKKMVTWLNKFYEEGIMPETWLTDGTKEWAEYVASEQSFITVDYIGRIDYFNNMVRPEIPEFTMNYMEPPIGFEGGEKWQLYYPGADNGMAISSLTEDLDAALAYIDWFYSPEGVQMATWGKEGEVWEKSGDNWELTSEYAARAENNDFDFTKMRQEIGIYTNGAYIKMEDWNTFSQFTSPELAAALEVAPQYMMPAFTRVPALTKAERDQIALKLEAINKAFLENIAQFVIGERDMDEWDDYTESLNDLGLQEVLDVYTKAYQRMSDN
ncbi:extracellular solute-binding protein [Pontibacillus sp. HMF3514]|uniref:extracellular solute-binding protein n=1 Tax=Pontibacillus sp. HMF3514 TaxID=2692425 RepID=UPI00131F925C|nr:extracellular solute-binding protein [Pontibacillus sp. HMF3514]QHE53029.1 extracellular solute-binding protein [Pontibacillus sp. HMF3514]